MVVKVSVLLTFIVPEGTARLTAGVLVPALRRVPKFNTVPEGSDDGSGRLSCRNVLAAAAVHPP